MEAPVAQRIRALPSEGRGRRFKSCRVHHQCGVSSVVEHLAYNQAVGGSIPSPRTSLNDHYMNLPRKREQLWLAAGKKCHWCGEDTYLIGNPTRWQATIDHIIPRYKQGTNDPANLVSACRQCNARRNKEDHLGLAEGALLGKFQLSVQKKTPVTVRVGVSAMDAIRYQRDQALARVFDLAAQNGQLRQQVIDLERKLDVHVETNRRLASMTVMELVKKKTKIYCARVAQLAAALAR